MARRVSPMARRVVDRAGASRPTPATVVRRGDQWHLIAVRSFAIGERILEIDGVLSDRPNRYSIQFGPHEHVYPPPEVDGTTEGFVWRFLNHSCDPSAVIVGRSLVALRPLCAGDELTFDYNTTEDEIAESFSCRCGHCAGRLVRGFRHLDPSEQKRLLPYLALHLRMRYHPDSVTDAMQQ